ncbi:MAG: response regulator [Geobacteraceae bacterium]|nr:response regulator [Geobacteraceae bacterium]NTW81403.1 response regulator [Geobacteraceae bacterium]
MRNQRQKPPLLFSTNVPQTGSLSPTIPVTPKENIRLLLAEDDPINQEITRGIMVVLGYSLDVVSNGHEALQALAESDYSLVLMDCQMPGMGGIEATAIIRDTMAPVRDHAVPVIALTGNDFKGDREKCFDAGMNDYLAKPYDKESLAAMIAKWLPTATADHTHIFDEASLLRQHCGDESFTREVAALFATKAPQYIEAIGKSLAESSAHGVRQHAHTLKGAAAVLGANVLASLAGELESLNDTDKLTSTEPVLQQLRDEFACLVKVLTQRGWFSP